MSNKLILDLIEEVPAPVSTNELQAALEPLLELFSQSDAMLEILFTTDEHMHKLNKQHRGVDATTDVLSLPTAFDTERGSVVPVTNHPINLGTIVISVDEAQRKLLSGQAIPDALPWPAKPAGRRGRDDLTAEVLGLVRHGLRHLLGHDHDKVGEWIV